MGLVLGWLNSYPEPRRKGHRGRGQKRTTPAGLSRSPGPRRKAPWRKGFRRNA